MLFLLNIYRQKKSTEKKKITTTSNPVFFILSIVEPFKILPKYSA